MTKVRFRVDSVHEDNDGNKTLTRGFTEGDVPESEAHKLYEAKRVDFVEEDDLNAYNEKKSKESDERVKNEASSDSLKILTRSVGMKGNDAEESNSLPSGDLDRFDKVTASGNPIDPDADEEEDGKGGRAGAEANESPKRVGKSKSKNRKVENS